jgi:CHAD domain-containing protein
MRIENNFRLASVRKDFMATIGSLIKQLQTLQDEIGQDTPVVIKVDYVYKISEVGVKRYTEAQNSYWEVKKPTETSPRVVYIRGYW